MNQILFALQLLHVAMQRRRGTWYSSAFEINRLQVTSEDRLMIKKGKLTACDRFKELSTMHNHQNCSVGFNNGSKTRESSYVK